MKEPRRLRDDPSSGLAGALLSSARSDEASDADRRRVAAALAAAAGATALSATGVAGSGATAAKLTSVVGLKVGLGTVFVAAAATTIVLRIAAPPAHPHPSPPPQPIAASAPIVPVAPPHYAPVYTPASASVSASASVAPSSVAPPKSSADTLAAELLLIDGARRAVRAGDSSGALSLLDRHRALFPRGELVVEATVLRIDALNARGDHETAKTMARAFLLAHPASPHAPRLRRTFGDDL